MKAGATCRPFAPDLVCDSLSRCALLEGARDPKHEKVVRVSTDGTVKSPDFPHTYPRNKALVWRLIAASENTQIRLTFDERFGLEEPEDGICKYDFVEIEEPAEGTILGRWCGSQRPGRQVSKGNQIRIRFVSDQYLPSKPGFCIHYSLVPLKGPEPEEPTSVPPSLHSVDVLTAAVSGFSTVEDVMKYLEPDRWQLDMENLYKPTWHALGKTFLHPKKSRGNIVGFLVLLSCPSVPLRGATPIESGTFCRESHGAELSPFWTLCLNHGGKRELTPSPYWCGRSPGTVDLNALKEEVRLYSCTPRNFSVSLREELRRTDAIFWPGCLLVKRCGGNCACCAYGCHDCQCAPAKVTKKYHEVLQLKLRSGGRGLQKSLTDVHLEHHEECACICKDGSRG
ncbi:platelet-derived growth factor C-like [Scleropages formosus]|uniref:Platelet-derived growth factor C n=1 Tax=Scleropages formosus TaxID=113540 RepID=A0A0P7WHB8_SCLFO|nr:platelet-derived growth factor C-like [Scleropages formosus]